jgi:hypothetical protein
MYAVVYKDMVIVGPMDWNRAIFQGSLERQNIVVGLPRVAPDTLPYVVNDDARIMMVEERRPEINQLVEYHYGPLWDVSGSMAIANYEIYDIQIDSARYNLKVQAAEERWKKEIAGTIVNIQGSDFTLDTTREGRNIFLQKYSLMSDGDIVNWKFPEGWVLLTKEELGTVIAAGASYIQTCFDWEKNISDLIDAATTKEELLAIEIVEKNENISLVE